MPSGGTGVLRGRLRTWDIGPNLSRGVPVEEPLDAGLEVDLWVPVEVVAGATDIGDVHFLVTLAPRVEADIGPLTRLCLQQIEKLQ